MEILKMQKRVKRGIRYLNEVKPNWYKKINLNKLNLQKEDVCVCGQLFKSFWSVIYHDDTYDGEARKQKKIAMRYKDACKRGFALTKNLYIHNKKESYDLLTRIWYIEICKLREK